MKYFKRYSLELASFVIILTSICVFACSKNDNSTYQNQPEGYKKTPESAADNQQKKTSSSIEPASKQEGNESVLAKIIFITTTQACHCTLTRCKNGEAIVRSALAGIPEAPYLEIIDSSKESDRANILVQKHKAVMLPIALFLDADEGLLDMIQGEFSEFDVKGLLEEYLGKDGK